MRFALILALGLVFATGLGLGAHFIARDTVALPVSDIEAGDRLAPVQTTTQERTTTRPGATTQPTTGRTTTATTRSRVTTVTPTRARTTTEDDSGRGRGRGRNRGRGGGGDSDD